MVGPKQRCGRTGQHCEVERRFCWALSLLIYDFNFQSTFIPLEFFVLICEFRFVEFLAFCVW